jgi:hypothetical protein
MSPACFRARHIRCDQKRPECENCISSNRQCEGFPAPVAAAGASRSNSPNIVETIAAYNIPFKVPGSQADRQLLHYYCCQAAWNLSSFADPTLWTELILQQAHDQSVVRNGLVTLSSLHKDFAAGLLGSSGKQKPSLNVDTMTMVSKCYGQLSNYLARAESTPNVALVCSVIFYSLESLLGDTQQAMSHLDSGLRLLKRAQSNAKWAQDPLLVHLTHLFERLDHQASSYDDTRVPVLELVTAAETQGTASVVPKSFDSLDNAEAVLTKLQNWTLRQLISNVEHKGKGPESFPEELWRERIVLRKQFRKYRQGLAALGSSIETLQVDLPGQKTAQDRNQIQRQRYLLLQVNFHTFAYLVEENVPDFLDDMNEVLLSEPPPQAQYSDTISEMPGNGVRHAEDDLSAVVGKLEALLSRPNMSLAQAPSAAYPLASPSQRTYTLSSFILAALYFVCFKTTRPEILIPATNLFSHPLLKNSRDGLWDGQLAQTVVEGVMKLRDQTLGLNEDVMGHAAQDSIQPTDDIPGHVYNEFDPDASWAFHDAALGPDGSVSYMQAAYAAASDHPWLTSGTDPAFPSEDPSWPSASMTIAYYPSAQLYPEHGCLYDGGFGPSLEAVDVSSSTQKKTGPIYSSMAEQQVEIRPMLQYQPQRLENRLTQHNGGTARKSHPRLDRLEEAGLGFVDVDGGLEEAARRLSLLCL